LLLLMLLLMLLLICQLMLLLMLWKRVAACTHSRVSDGPVGLR